MSDTPAHDVLVQAVHQFIETRQQLQRLRTVIPYYAPADCPLVSDDQGIKAIDYGGHYELSRALWGAESWAWTCQFCHTAFEE